jgi:hypothetical protein
MVMWLTSADVETNVETLGAALETVVVGLAVQVEELVRVDTVGLETLEHVLGAEVCKSRVIDLDGLEASVVQNLELLLVGSGQIGEESIIGGVDLLGGMVNLHWSHCDSGTCDLRYSHFLR